MSKRILIIQAHPDTSRLHLAHSLAAAYVKGAEGAGHVVRQVVLATLDFPLLRSQQQWEEGSVPASLKSAPAYRSWLCAVGARPARRNVQAGTRIRSRHQQRFVVAQRELGRRVPGPAASGDERDRA